VNPRKCFACDRPLGKNPHRAVTEDGAQIVFVGGECWKLIGPNGYQPPKGGPRLFRGKFSPSGELLEMLTGENMAGKTKQTKAQAPKEDHTG
jgi:hypothetical protein